MKKNTTNAINNRALNHSCGMAYTLSVIGGRWKISILAFLNNDIPMRFKDLKQKLEGISDKVLITQLKELEADGLIERIVYPEVPPKVEYKLTGEGKTLDTVLHAMSEWGEERRESIEENRIVENN